MGVNEEGEPTVKTSFIPLVRLADFLNLPPPPPPLASFESQKESVTLRLGTRRHTGNYFMMTL